MTAADLVKLTYFLTEEIPDEERAAIVHAAVGEEPPTATLVYVSRLAAPQLTRCPPTPSDPHILTWNRNASGSSSPASL